jgi:chromosomal replication initiator protein
VRETLNERAFDTWFSGVVAHVEDGALVLRVPNEFTRSWIDSRFLAIVESAARECSPELTGVRIEVLELPGESTEAAEPGEAAAGADAAASGSRAAAGDPSSVAQAVASTGARYTFESFVIGSSNRFAHAAALAVAERPAKAYNPLFIYGGTGLGKTHLLHAIAHYIGEHSPGLSVRYVTSEAFMNDFINSLKDKTIEGFKQRYRHYGMLLIDDIQFLEGKERIQEEFFHTFNTLYETGSQIVLSSDRKPREIATLEERLRSRFEWGLITDVQPPDVETRIAILRKKVNTDGIAVPDPEVLTLIAERVSTNIRELEGALTRVVAFSSLTGRELAVELAQEVLEEVFPEGAPPDVTIERIQAIVADRFQMSIDELISQRRSHAIAYPRQVAMYLCRELTDNSLPKIGREFGGRDHTTVIYATSKVANLINEDRDVYNLVQELTARIKQAR